MKLLSVLFLLFSAGIFGQPSRILYQEVNGIPFEKGQTVFYSFKLPYNRIVFEKNGSEYKAAFQISIEAFDSTSKSIARQIENYKIAVQSYEETNSSVNAAEGVLQLELPDGEYTLLPIITDLNSRTELKLPSIAGKYYPKSNYILEPVIVSAAETTCSGETVIEMANSGGGVPFSEREYNLLIPVIKDIPVINIKITNNNDTVFSGNIERSMKKGFGIKHCADKIVIDQSGSGFSYFFVKGISKKLAEGVLTISISESAASPDSENFIKEVKWLDKPLSAADPEFGIKSLKLIENENVIDEMLNREEEEYRQVLFEYWKKYDNDTATAFNPLMKQYYERVDYVVRNFSTITGKSGINSDRGKIYVRFGPPQDINRSSNPQGDVVEIWNYPSNRFVFVDKNGTGDFLLKES